MSDRKADIKKLAAKAKESSLALANAKTADKNKALKDIAASIIKNMSVILKENGADVKEARKAVDAGKMSTALLKRLMLDEEKVRGMAEGVLSVAKLPDPVGRVTARTEMDKGLVLDKVTCPIGVIGAIFESRPDAVVQIASLCLKSGNAVLLKGGAEAIRSNRILVKIMDDAARASGKMPDGWASLIETRAQVNEVLSMDAYIDLLVPRGSNEFVKYIQANTRIPVLGHADGICHVYVDKDADVALAATVALDSKIQYPAACNAAETLLVHRKVAPKFLPIMIETFRKAGVEIRACAETRKISGEKLKAAKEADWRTEYLDNVISIKIVESADEAVAHINKYGSGHTDSIITTSAKTAEKFLAEVKSACAFHNASTRFADGFRFGLGAEIGISTNRTHARGPVGLEGLVIYKYMLRGSGNIVADYSGPKARKYSHKKIL